ncbi:TPR repeats containing protein [Salinisphaera sp. PC39]|uniref:TRAP transporter TatT component family protein n=1 Tax=Salinisphaera sp. PC39 TaxID=1304156 RepID=UPI003342B46F
MRCLSFVVFLAAAFGAQAADFDARLLDIQHAWAHANYEVSGDARERAFEDLEERAAAFRAAYPDRAEALIWEGIVLSTYAGVKGGLGALGLAKKARADYEKALEMDETALAGSAHTSLGVLYYKVPGWPLGFGSNDKAEKHLRKALSINPDGIDPNFFYAEYLVDEKGDYRAARRHLEKALSAPDRPDRPVADAGRRAEVRRLLARLDERERD